MVMILRYSILYSFNAFYSDRCFRWKHGVFPQPGPNYQVRRSLDENQWQFIENQYKIIEDLWRINENLCRINDKSLKINIKSMKHQWTWNENHCSSMQLNTPAETASLGETARRAKRAPSASRTLLHYVHAICWKVFGYSWSRFAVLEFLAQRSEAD